MKHETHRQLGILQVADAQHLALLLRAPGATGLPRLIRGLHDVQKVRDEPGVVLHVRREDQPSKQREKHESLLPLLEHRVKQTPLCQQRTQDVIVPVLVHAHVVPPHGLGSFGVHEVGVIEPRVPDVVRGGGEHKRRRLDVGELRPQAAREEVAARLDDISGVRRRVVVVGVIVPFLQVLEELPERGRVQSRERVEQPVPVHQSLDRPDQNPRRAFVGAPPQILRQTEGVEPVPRVHRDDDRVIRAAAVRRAQRHRPHQLERAPLGTGRSPLVESVLSPDLRLVRNLRHLHRVKERPVVDALAA
mmetsp:Transcript_9921/g.43231  ORF Transcript_9921/g.43231 Transcript_9921/m.43231 type:complete len:304 (+) Transcript_9921:1212-2123(+)